MKCRELALFLGGCGDWPAFPGAGGYDRVYFGEEFCERRMPSREVLASVAAAAADRRAGITLVTPVMSNSGIKELPGLLDILAEHGGESPEVVVNDWGAMAVLNSGHKGRFRLLMGRLLTPRRAASDLSDDFLDFVKEKGFSGIEFNRLPSSPGLLGDLHSRGLICSLHLPYSFVTVTRFCFWANGGRLSYRDATRAGGAAGEPGRACKRQCSGRYALMKDPASGDDWAVRMKGNAWLERGRAGCGACGPTVIDRAVDNSLMIAEGASCGAERIAAGEVS